jgi:hypothetical protein
MGFGSIRTIGINSGRLPSALRPSTCAVKCGARLPDRMEACGATWFRMGNP